ncbi:MAG: peptidylprolyl isomerase [Candidatus Cloacimonadales bacterium]
MQELISDITFEEADLLRFYEENKQAFVTSDSLQLGICYFPKLLDNFELSETELRQQYQQQEFYRERSVKYDFVFTPQREIAELACNYFREGIDISTLKEIYSEPCELPAEQIIEYQDLPEKLIVALQKIDRFECSEPLPYQDGWLVLAKFQDYPAGVPAFAEVKEQIAHKIRNQEAELAAYQNARTVFDSTRYFSQARRFATDENIYKTEFQDAYDEFEILGNISDHRRELMRIWANEKYSRIIDTGQGFAVVYLLKKSSSQQLDFTEAKPRIKQMIIAQDHNEKAQEYTQRLADRIANGANPDELLYFISSWQKAKISSIDSDLFKSKFSPALIQDITKHQQGYFSPIIKLEAERFLFYEIETMNKISRQDFEAEKDAYREQVAQELLHDWLRRARNISKILQ